MKFAFFMRSLANKVGAANAGWSSQFRFRGLRHRPGMADLHRWTNMRAMKAVVILLLSCASVLGADTSIHVVTTTTTNAETLSISTKDVFTRDGQTNLVRNTNTKAGVVQIQIHRFYHAGALVGMLAETPDSSSTTSEAGCPFALDFEYGPSHQLKYAAIVGQEGVLVDAFACTNCILSPVPSLELSNAAGIGADAKKLISGARKMSPEQFHREVEQMIEKHDK